MLRTYHFWIEDGECKDDSDLAKPTLELVDDSDLPLAGVCSWAADEIAEDELIDDPAMDLLVHDLVADSWYEVSLYRGGWVMLSAEKTDLKTIKEG